MTNPLASLGLASRLYAASIVLSLALAGVAVLAYVRLTGVSATAELTGQTRVPQLQRMASLELNVTRVSLQLRHAMLSRTPEEMTATLTDVGGKRKIIESTLADYEKALFTAEGKARFAKITPLVDRFWEIGGANIKLIQGGKKAEAFEFLVDKTIPARNILLAELNETVKFQEASLQRDLAQVESAANGTWKMLVGLVVAAMAGLMFLSWYIARSLRQRVAASQAVAERVRDGDLTMPVHDEASDEFSPLLTALGDMQTSLTRVVAEVRGNAESVATASAQIAQGNQDLSGRTEQQASALQQTAATMDELGSTVRNNADNARQANQLALGASTVAQKGGDVVGQVVGTMKDINDSSKKIADIITVIDGIAFQTNILALNAAVEAARAGEQGRGFAVVAGEVRSLAQRSAEAAREIKALITASVERVDQGSVLVGQAGQTMDEIVGAIKRVSDIVGEISSASTEQSSGVNQVGQAVSQMDQATQQNAALVEESAAAAESLRGQATQLVQAVAVFKLNAGEYQAAAGAAANRPIAERRGPQRATNVSRPAFASKAKTAAVSPAQAAKPAAAPQAAPAQPAPAKTGTDDWESF
jgi:methyl-accepting chemotaxis protein